MTGEMAAGALLGLGLRKLQAGTATQADPNCALDAQVLLAHLLGIPRSRLNSHPETPCAQGQVREYLALLERRVAGEPVAYLTGRREFWSLELRVSPAVLVPRPETELLIERALTLRAASGARVADLGTGSGAIALALASERPLWQLVATDVSEAALAVARGNAAVLGLPGIEFRLGDWYAALPQEPFDLIISNPPYIDAADKALALLQHEPRLALTPGPMAWPACVSSPQAQCHTCGPAAGCSWSTAATRQLQCAMRLSLQGSVT